MAESGPAPKTRRQRERGTRRRQVDAAFLPDDLKASFQHLTPRLRRGETLGDAPNCSRTQTGRRSGEPPVPRTPSRLPRRYRAVSELRLIEERLGATYVDRQRAKIRIKRGTEDAEVVELRSVSSRADVMARMRGER